ncbi:MAG: hypothetical protein EOO68_39905 [Moraxellaceae bacterium]|nr:MAG: hypothetical protein EOO68_39905 [Moraxellaceae bacterium]
MFSRKLYLTSLIPATLILAGSMAANAISPHHPDLVKDGNRWLVTAYDDSTTTHTQWATQGLCFYYAGTRGTQQLYYWVSDTFPDWNGRATQEGDQIFMHGDYAKDVGHDGFEWQITTVSPKSEGYGHWKEWREDGRLGLTIGFANAKLTRVGKCVSITHAEAVELGSRIELRLNANKELMVVPSGLSERQVLELEKEDQSTQAAQ